MKPNIILITIDSLRADHLGFMSYKKDISPNIDKLAKESNVFTQAFANGSSTPYSFPSILTSTYALDYQGPQKIERPRVLISEVLKKEGYITAAFHSNPFLSDFFGYNQGWDFFEDITLPTGKLREKNIIKKFLRKSFKDITFSFFPQLFFKMKYLKYKRKEVKIGLKIKATYINQVAEDFIQSVKNEENPFFLWVHYMDVHGPYLPRASYYEDRVCSYSEMIAGSYINYLVNYFHKKSLKKFLQKYFSETINLYDQGIEYVDEKVGELLNFLKKENIYQDSIICLSSDHGDELFEHASEKNGGISHFGCNLYNELLHVPLLIRVPGGKGNKIEKKVSLIDLAPTLCDLAEVKPNSSFKGKNLFNSSPSPLFHQAAPHISDNQVGFKSLLKELSQYRAACQFNNWKYILNQSNHSEELYNLTQDPKEQNNLAESQFEIVSKMREKIEEFEKENPPFSLLKK